MLKNFVLTFYAHQITGPVNTFVVSRFGSPNLLCDRTFFASQLPFPTFSDTVGSLDQMRNKLESIIEDPAHIDQIMRCVRNTWGSKDAVVMIEYDERLKVFKMKR